MNRARYQKYIGWYSQLHEQEKSRLDNVCNNILSMVPQCLEDLNGETNIRRCADMQSLQGFYKEELKRAVDQAMKLPLSDQRELNTLFGFILYEIESGAISLSELYPILSSIEPPEKILHPESYKWFKSTVEVLSYLLYAVQIKALICEGIFEGTRRESEPLKETSNEILYLLTRQVIISAGGMDDILGQKQPEGSTGAPTKHFFTFEGKHTPEQRNNFRLWLISKEIIENISQDEFEYLFTVNKINEGMQTIVFREAAAQARTLLRILVDNFEGIPIREKRFVRANLCITLKSGKKISRNTKVAKEAIFEDMLK